MILFNSGTWVCISRKTLKVLDDLFHSFCQIIFRVSSGCPIPSFYWQSGSRKFENIILENKVNFIFHLANLPLNSLARTIYEEQNQNPELPGLVSDCKEHIQQIYSGSLNHISKWAWKRKVKSYFKNRNTNQLLEEIKRYKKLNYEELRNESFERKSYFSDLDLENARMIFRVRSNLVQTVRRNFSRKYRTSSLKCQSCFCPDASPNNQTLPEDTQSHLISHCSAFDDLRVKHDLDTDKGLGEFFREVVNRRIERGED